MKTQVLSMVLLGVLTASLAGTAVVSPAYADHDDFYRGNSRCGNGQRPPVLNGYANHYGNGYNNGYGNQYYNNGYPNQYHNAGYPTQYNNGYGNQQYYGNGQYYHQNNAPFFRGTGGKVVKGALVGGGIGAVTGVVLNRPIIQTGLIGAAVGAGTQAIRYSNW
jgi:hypothetical protein